MEMKSILFLDRAPLTHLYARMSKYLQDVNVTHVAYNENDVEILKSYGLKADYVLMELFKKEYDSCDVSQEVLDSIDNDLIEQSKGRFNLNASIQSDRSFTVLSYEEALRSAVSYYNIWNSIFAKGHVDLVAHEPCSLFFNHICSILCKKQGGVYSYQIASLSDKYEYSYLNANNDDYDFAELKYNFKKYLKNPELIDKERTKIFIDKFREDNKVFLGNILNRKQSYSKLLLMSIKRSINCLIMNKKFDRVYDPINYWIVHNNVSWLKLKNAFGYKRKHIRFESDYRHDEKFLFYPIHLEPEAVVLYLGDGLYRNQTKLIENIAASLPAGYYLYVKDHPHEYAYREPIDYERLQRVPNIRLLNQWLPGKEVIRQSQGVVTINGSAGFEAYMLGKPVYSFGNNQYSFLSNVYKVDNIRDLRDIVYKSTAECVINEEELDAYVMAYLESCHPGYMDCYTGGAYLDGFDYEKNAKTLAEDMKGYVFFLKKQL